MCQDPRQSKMKGRHLIFLLTVSVLLKTSNGEAFFMGQKRHGLFRSDINRGIGSQYFSSKHQPVIQDEYQRQLWYLLKFRGRKRGRFFSPKRSVSTLSCARKMIQDSLVKTESNLRSLPNKCVSNTKSMQGKRRTTFESFQIPKLCGGTAQRLVSMFQYSLLGLIGFELILILRDIFQEIRNDANDLSGDDNIVYGIHRKAISRDSVEKLIHWLEKPEEERPAPPSTLPAWLLSLGQELFQCTELTSKEVERILLQLTDEEARLFRACLLRTNRKAFFAEFGGTAKISVAQLLLSSSLGSRTPFPSEIQESSPYEKIISKGNIRNNMVLWGPSGSGKSLLIRAVSTHSGLPTLVISPMLIQSFHKLETLFSLVSTLGSCVLVLDDLDGLFPNRGNGDQGIAPEIKAELLRWWDAVASFSTKRASDRCVFVVAATSRPWDVDDAAWRRLTNRIYIGLPNAEDRYDILKVFSKYLPPIEESVLQYFVSVTEGFIPLDLYQVLVHACQNGPILRQDKMLTIEDVRVALSMVVPTIFSAQYLQNFDNFISSHRAGLEWSTMHTQTQQTSTISGSQFCENGYCWETSMGNFYEFQIPVDSEVLTAIQTILLHSSKWSSSVLDDSDDDDDSEDDKYY